ncbi:MAG: YHS domain-containing (seleno)protein [Pseudomonadota bacterium]
MRLAIVSLLLVLTAPTDLAAEVNLNPEGLALHGYDPVAYLDDGTAVMGSSDFTAEHDGAVYQFASKDNRDRFLASGSGYVPQYGGFCAYGVRMGQKFDINPEAFSVIDGRLYVLLDNATHSLWLQDPETNIRIADETWPQLQGLSD